MELTLLNELFTPNEFSGAEWRATGDTRHGQEPRTAALSGYGAIL